MSLSDFEIGKIAEIVAGKSGAKLDAKALRQVIDRVVDALKEQQANPEIEGATCETGKPVSSPSGVDVAREAMLSKPPASPAKNVPGERAQREKVASPPGEGGNPSAPVIARSEDTRVAATRQSQSSSLPPPDEALITAEGGAVRTDREDREDARHHRRFRQGPSRYRCGAYQRVGRAQLFD